MRKGNSTVVIRPEKPQDYAGIHEVYRLVFRREIEARLVENLRASPAFVADLSIVAVGGKNVVGHALFSPVSIEMPYDELPAVALVPIAVRSEYQKQDVFVRMLRQGLKVCNLLGYLCVITVGEPSEYIPLGFMPASRKGLRMSFRIDVGELLVLEIEKILLDGTEGIVKLPPVFDELWEALIC